MTTAFRIGSVASDVLADIKRGNNSATADKYSTFEWPDGTPVQVTAGRTLYITRIRFQSTSADSSIVLGYGDDAVDTAVGAPTAAKILEKKISVVVANDEVSFDVFIPIPAAKFPYFRALIGTLNCSFEGIEITNP